MEAQELDEKLLDLRKKLDETFVNEIKAASPEVMKEMVVQLSKSVEDRDLEKANDNKLKLLRTQVADLNGGYRDAKKAITRKLQYVLLTLQERGKL